MSAVIWIVRAVVRGVLAGLLFIAMYYAAQIAFPDLHFDQVHCATIAGTRNHFCDTGI